MGQIDGPLAGLVVIALVTLICGVTVGGVLYQAEIVHGLRRLVSRFSPPTPPPEGPPIERIGCDARRLRRELLALAPDIPIARRTGLQLAYDDVSRTPSPPFPWAPNAMPSACTSSTSSMPPACVFMREPIAPAGRLGGLARHPHQVNVLTGADYSGARAGRLRMSAHRQFREPSRPAREEVDNAMADVHAVPGAHGVAGRRGAAEASKVTPGRSG